MESLVPGGVAIADGSVSVEEESRSHQWLEDYLVQLEGKAARKESLDSREYYTLIASLMA